jgi:DNA-binding transcriptional regulator PaaX
MKKFEHGEITEIILSTLLVVGVIAVAVTMPNAVQLFKYFKPKNTFERRKIKRSVYGLEKSGFIQRKNKEDDIFILTEKGRERAMRYALAKMKIASQKKWDKKWRLVMFDVPEKKMQARRAINFALKRLGFVQYQKSIFVTPFPCEKEIDFVGGCFRIRENIRIVVASEIEGEDTLRKAFNV